MRSVLISVALMSVLFASCGRRVPEAIPVLALPAERCHVQLHGSDGPSYSAVQEGAQVFFADYFRSVRRPVACAGTDWVPVCIRSERVDSFFFVDSAVGPRGDRRGFADIHFRNGFRYRVCYDGRVLPLDGANWGNGQEACPRSYEGLLRGLPSYCREDSKRLVPDRFEEDSILCRRYGICPGAASR